MNTASDSDRGLSAAECRWSRRRPGSFVGRAVRRAAVCCVGRRVSLCPAVGPAGRRRGAPSARRVVEARRATRRKGKVKREKPIGEVGVREAGTF